MHAAVRPLGCARHARMHTARHIAASRTRTCAQVRFYYSFTSKENLYIVMEYLNGGDCYR